MKNMKIAKNLFIYSVNGLAVVLTLEQACVIGSPWAAKCLKYAFSQAAISHLRPWLRNVLFSLAILGLLSISSQSWSY